MIDFYKHALARHELSTSVVTELSDSSLK